MAWKNQYSEKNASSFIELQNFISRLTAEQLGSNMPAGWNVLAVLAHIAFWDIRALTLINRWETEGINHPSEIDADLVNEVTRPIFLLLDQAKAKEMILDYAKKIDEKIDSLSPDFVKKIETEGKNVHLDRSKHRLMHIIEIKQVIEMS